MTENKYQALLIRKLKSMFPGCIIMKMESGYLQGFPDLIVLWGRYWASLEVKPNPNALAQPNQEHYIEQLNEMSFAAFINPENEREVLDALQQAFKPPRRARVSKP